MTYGKLNRLLLTAVAGVALVFAFAATAGATAPSPKLSYADLMSRLETAPAGQLPGYFLTVVEGSTIETVPATITGYTPGGGWRDSLIFFQGTGPVMAATQGIAQGMSGSPLYLATGELIGAVAYGDWFTPSGHGLATPIEAMERVESEYAGRTPLGLQPLKLNAPVFANGKVVDRVIITDDPAAHAADAATGTFVARPLNTLTIGGVKSSTKAGKRLAKRLEKLGRSYRFTTVGGRADDPSIPASMTPLQPGSAVYALESVGSVFSGSMGTTTYTDGDNVLMFGHTYGNPGQALDLYMAEGWVTGVWPSEETSYKLGTPTVVNGTVVADGLDGVLGVAGLSTPDVAITSTATNAATGEVETRRSWIKQSLLRDDWYDEYAIDLIDATLTDAPYRLCDYGYLAGSAKTEGTLVVYDGTKDVTLTFTNSYSSDDDIAYLVSSDLYNALWDLLTLNTWKNEPLVVKSVSLNTTLNIGKPLTSTAVGIEAPNGLKVGTNTVKVKLFTTGVKDASYETTSIVLNGEDFPDEWGDPQATGALVNSSDYTLTVTPYNSYKYSDYYDDDDYMYSLSGDAGANSAERLKPFTAEDPTDEPYKRPSLEEIIKDLQEQKPNQNEKLVVSLYQGSSEIASTTVDCANNVDGTVSARSTAVSATLSKTTLAYGKKTTVTGVIDGPLGTPIYLYGTPAGSKTEKLLATGRASSEDDLNKTSPSYSYDDDDDDEDDEDAVYGVKFKLSVPALKANTKLRVVAAGTTKYLTGVSPKMSAKVKAKVTVKAAKSKVKHGKKVKLTAGLTSANPKGGKLYLERKKGKKWVKIKTWKVKSTKTSLKYSYSWKTPRTRGKVSMRARWGGNSYNYKATGGTKRVTVK
ncbi:MAG: hypothetical protein LBS17_00215 [Actinomycetes bacterium]|jgi:hypothetical protein|nr:hypothetical protein [Actinomycetes bacterium]